MLASWFGDLGAWNWIILGCVLLAAEILAPGVFLLWIGVAALLTGGLSFQLSGWESWTWQVQVVVFLALSLASAWIGSRIVRAREQKSDQPLLNLRAEQLIGRSAIVTDPIVNGVGRVRLGDTTWRVTGPDLPAGSHVRIIRADGSELAVERE